MADVFERRSDLDPWRERLWNLIDQTPALDWLLLTKRPDRVGKCVPWGRDWPDNVWLGTTTENQSWANRRLDELLRYPARVRFVSAEPLIGALDLRPWLKPDKDGRRIDWVIAGGESGAKARPMNPEWARELRDQCERAGVAFHFKQWGHWSPDAHNQEVKKQRVTITDARGRPITLVKVGKKASGRVLDGRTWDGLPRASLGA
jgi:protein gp37